MEKRDPWLDWAVELQSLAQAGLYYGKDVYDRERYQRIREIAADMLAEKSELPAEKVRELFCCEVGYQTPKLDTRAAIFLHHQILLVKERNGKWALPGGWVDVNLSVMESAVKEVWEEAGLRARADLVIAVQDREKHNQPRYAYRICKVFLLCTALGGAFQENSETLESRYFDLRDLPPLAEDKNTVEQIEMCFVAHHAEHWHTLIE
ncbi:MAG: NUDIX hydrolase [Eubacteriales bacterium]|nr:NUDIX hydrolase [Eubacteriales bacterium]